MGRSKQKAVVPERLAHVLDPKMRRKVRPYSVNRLGRASSAAGRVIRSTEEIQRKLLHCQRGLHEWDSKEVHRQLTLETRSALVNDVVTMREAVRELLRLLSPGREGQS